MFYFNTYYYYYYSTGAPGPPGEPFITRYGSALTIHWTSGDPGRAPITRYVIEARPSGVCVCLSCMKIQQSREPCLMLAPSLDGLIKDSGVKCQHLLPRCLRLWYFNGLLIVPLQVETIGIRFRL